MADETRSIGTTGRDYATFSAFNAAINNTTYPNPNTRAIGEAYDDSVFNEALLLDGTATNVDDILLTAAAGQKHTGVAGLGARVVQSAANVWEIQNNVSGSVIIEDIEVDGGNNGGGYKILNLGADTVGRRLLLHGIENGTTAALLADLGNSARLINSIMYHGWTDVGGGTSTLVQINAGASAKGDFCNNTVHDCRNDRAGGTGPLNALDVQDNRTDNLINNLVTDATVAGSGTPTCYVNTGATGTVSNNASTDASAPGTSPLINILAADQYISTVIGSEDLNLKAGAGAILVGANLTGTFPEIEKSVNGLTRPPAGAWDIGASMFQSAQTGQNDLVWQHGAQQSDPVYAPEQYRILRDVDGVGEAQIDTVAGTVLAYSDVDPPGVQQCYRIEPFSVDPGAGTPSNQDCVPSSGATPWLGIREAPGGDRTFLQWEEFLGRQIDVWAGDLGGRSQADGWTHQAGADLSGVPTSRKLNMIWDLPETEGGSAVTLAGVNAGTWDTEIAAVGQNFINQGHGHAQFRLLHEGDLAAIHHSFRGGGQAGPVFRAAWQRIHGIVMALLGANFEWEFNVNGPGKNPTPTTENDDELGPDTPLLDVGYAGDAYVTHVGNGSYFRSDSDPVTLTATRLAENEYVRDFTLGKSKKYNCIEYGLWLDGVDGYPTPGDYPDWLNTMNDFFVALGASAGTLCYFNIPAKNELNATNFPLSEQRFLEIYGAGAPDVVVDHTYTVASQVNLLAHVEDDIGYVEVFRDSVAVAVVNATDDNVRCSANEDAVGYIYRVDQATADADYSAEITSEINPTHLNRPNLVFVRVTDADNWICAGRYGDGADPDLVLYEKTTAGGLQQLGTANAGAPDTGKLKAQAIGTTAKVFFQGSELISATTTVTAQGFAGIGHGNILVATDELRTGERIDDLLVVNES